MTDNFRNIFVNNNELEKKFNSLSFPTKKTEDWIYTNPNMLFEGIDSLEENKTNSIGLGDIVFSNGKIISNKTKIEITENKNKPDLDDAVSLLQEAADSYELMINKSITSPVFISQNYENSSSNFLSGSNLTINIKKNTEVTIVEVISGDGPGLHSGLTKLALGDNAKVEYVKILPAELNNKYLGSVVTNQARDSYFNGVIVTLGSAVSRHHLTANLNGENATGSFHGLFTLDHDQHSDTLSFIKHNAPRTYSSQLYKGALNGKSRGVFTGKLYIARDAQEVDANQLSKNLLLSPKAHVDTRPQLEVYADDVKAAHGATVGQIGEEEVFYLQSRGIDSTTAFNMLCDAFSADVIDHVQNQSVKNYLNQELKKKSLTKTEDK